MKQPKSLVYLNKTAHHKPKTLFKHIAEYLDKNPIYFNLIFSFQTTKVLFFWLRLYLACHFYLHLLGGAEGEKENKTHKRKWAIRKQHILLGGSKR